MIAINNAPSSMKMGELRERAKSFGISCGKLKKTELIWAIQKAEGFTVCYGSSNGGCPNFDCCFMKDCLKIKS